MGFVESFGRMQSCGKKQCRSLFWRIRAAMKKKTGFGSKAQFKFQYDPYSYALNFDDGLHQEMCVDLANKKMEFLDSSETKPIWIYVLWLE